MAPKARYTDGEKVLCFHGPLLYEAKCLKAQLRDKHMKYFIHYSGWNKNWDEWVPECRVLKYNDANLQKQKELQLTHTGSKKSKGLKLPAKKEVVEKEKESTAQATSPPEKPKVKVEKRSAPSPVPEISPTPESVHETKKKKKPEPCFMEEFEPEKEIKLNIPPLLKEWLLDDWDLITKQKKILHLPARITVDHIIAGYVKEKVSVKGISQSAERKIIVFANDVRNCFNNVLGKLVLFKFERPQYGEILVEYPEKNMCEIYGAVHLLRMLTKTPARLTALSIKGRLELMVNIEDFMRYISQNSNFFSLNDYVVASPEYHRRAL